MSQYVVCALYKFVTLDDYEALRQPLLDLMLDAGIRGTLLLAHEGINGTVSGTEDAITRLKSFLEADPRLAGIPYKESRHDEQPFYRTKVKLKREIVTMGVEDIDPKRIVGTYVAPKDWNALISDPEVVVIDTRNNYEVQIGSFERAINPGTETFREFPRYVAEKLDPQQHRKVAMFCTGGIRCEKSTAYLKAQGFDEVYHLEGGILKYLEDVPEEQSLWRGDCFVFDDRVAVNHRLEKGEYDQCHACRMPITQADMDSEHYVKGVSCPHCYDQHSDEKKARFAERERQVQLAKERGERHVGAEAAEAIEQRRREKYAARNRQKATASDR